MPTTTTRLALTQPVGADLVSQIRTSMTANASTLDNTVLVTEGTLAGRPNANTFEKDHIYKATDATPPTWYMSDGTNWHPMDIGLSRGTTNIATLQSISSTSYTTLITADQVQNLVLPTDGLIAIWYQATWKETVANAARAAIFIGANQVKVAPSNTGPALTQAAATGASATTNTNFPLFSLPSGLASTVGTAYTGDVTTGQVVGFVSTGTNFYSQEIGGSVVSSSAGVFGLGGPCWVFAAAGSYDVIVKFKASSGSVLASNRKLWVETLVFT